MSKLAIWKKLFSKFLNYLSRICGWKMRNDDSKCKPKSSYNHANIDKMVKNVMMWFLRLILILMLSIRELESTYMICVLLRMWNFENQDFALKNFTRFINTNTTQNKAEPPTRGKSTTKKEKGGLLQLVQQLVNV